MESKERKESAFFHLAGLVVLCGGILLELSSLSFLGLDLLVGALFAAALVLGALDTFVRTKAGWGFFTAGLGALALSLHLLLSLPLFP